MPRKFTREGDRGSNLPTKYSNKFADTNTNLPTENANLQKNGNYPINSTNLPKGLYNTNLPTNRTSLPTNAQICREKSDFEGVTYP